MISIDASGRNLNVSGSESTHNVPYKKNKRNLNKSDDEFYQTNLKCSPPRDELPICK